MYLLSNGIFCATRSQNTYEIFRKFLKQGIPRELSYVQKKQKKQASLFNNWADKGMEGHFIK